MEYPGNRSRTFSSSPRPTALWGKLLARSPAMKQATTARRPTRLPLAFVSEALFIAGMLLIPGAVALYASLASREGPKAAVGAGVLVVTLPVLFATLVIHGRLVYDVYGLRVRDPTAAELTVALYAGGMHAVFLMLAVATLVLSLAMRATYGRAIVGLGIATAVLDIAAAYPWALGAPVLVLCQVVFTAWFVAVGSKLWLLGSAAPAAAF